MRPNLRDATTPVSCLATAPEATLGSPGDRGCPDNGVIAVMIGATSAACCTTCSRRLPEPVAGDGRPIYRALGTSRFVLGCGALAGVAAAISWLSVPHYAQPMWSVLAILGVLLAAIDARTSWLPLHDPHGLAGDGGDRSAGGLVGRRRRGRCSSRSRCGNRRRPLSARMAALPRWLRLRRRAVCAVAGSRSRRLVDVAVVDIAARHRHRRADGSAATCTGSAGRIPVRTIDAGRCLRRLPGHHAQLTMLGCSTPRT